MSAAPHPLPATDRPLDVAPIHFCKEVRVAKRFASAGSDTVTLAGQVIDGLTNAVTSRASGHRVADSVPDESVITDSVRLVWDAPRSRCATIPIRRTEPLPR
jgi:hypothetical protein